MVRFVSLKKDTVQWPAEEPLLRAQDYAAYADAQALIDHARERAAEIIAQAEQAFSDEQKRGYEDGLQQAKLEQTERIMETVDKTVDYLSRVEHDVVGVVTNALKKILGEISDQELIVGVVRNALELVRSQHQVVLRVAPDQADKVRASLSDILSAYHGIGYVDVVADARLERGGCILESDLGIIDASVDVQLETINKALQRSFEQR